MNRLQLSVPLLFLICGLNSCSSSLSPQDVFNNHQDMFDAVKSYINDPTLFVDGEWQAHWGDGQLFGPSFDLAHHQDTGEQSYLDRALLSLEVNRARVAEAAPALMNFSDQLETTLNVVYGGTCTSMD